MLDKWFSAREIARRRCPHGIRGVTTLRAEQEEQRRQTVLREEAERRRLADIARHKEKVDQLSAREFEEFVASAYRALGYGVNLTPYQNDEGIDIFLHKNNGKIGVQIKKQQGNIGQPILRDFYGAMMHHQCSEGIFITTSDFTEQATSFHQGKRIILVNRDRLFELLSEAFPAPTTPWLCPNCAARLLVTPGKHNRCSREECGHVFFVREN